MNRCQICYKFYKLSDLGEVEFADTCSLRCSMQSWQGFANVNSDFRAPVDFSILKKPMQAEAITQWTKGRYDRMGRPGLLSHGMTSGTGKTRLATHAISTLVGMEWQGFSRQQKRISDGDGEHGIWMSSGGFKNEYRRIYKDYEQAAVFVQRLISADALMIDDISKFKASDGLLEVLFSVLDDRLTDNKTTILTTNRTGDELAEHWGDEYGGPLVRRLEDYCLTVDFDV